MTVWHYPDDLPENGRKIEMVFMGYRSPECDTWDGGLVLNGVDWNDVVMWRYVDEQVPQQTG